MGLRRGCLWPCRSCMSSTTCRTGRLGAASPPTLHRYRGLYLGLRHIGVVKFLASSLLSIQLILQCCSHSYESGTTMLCASYQARGQGRKEQAQNRQGGASISRSASDSRMAALGKEASLPAGSLPVFRIPGLSLMMPTSVGHVDLSPVFLSKEQLLATWVCFHIHTVQFELLGKHTTNMHKMDLERFFLLQGAGHVARNGVLFAQGLNKPGILEAN